MTICELCEVQYDLAEGENYIAPENLRLIQEWHERGHVGSVFPNDPTYAGDRAS